MTVLPSGLKTVVAVTLKQVNDGGLDSEPMGTNEDSEKSSMAAKIEVKSKSVIVERKKGMANMMNKVCDTKIQFQV